MTNIADDPNSYFCYICSDFRLMSDGYVILNDGVWCCRFHTDRDIEMAEEETRMGIDLLQKELDND
jgi:hypothetical protein